MIRGMSPKDIVRGYIRDSVKGGQSVLPDGAAGRSDKG